MPETTYYGEEISRRAPGCIVFLVDSSAGMAEVLGSESKFDGRALTKAQWAADLVNRVLATIIIGCAREEGVRDYFDVGVWGYGDGSVRFLLDTSLVGVSRVWAKLLRVEEEERCDSRGGVFKEEFPVWVDAVAGGDTPMCLALGTVAEELSRWMERHPSSFPPIVINVSGGWPTDGGAAEVGRQANRLTGLRNKNGSTALLLNVYLSDAGIQEIRWPAESTAVGSDPLAKLLFEVSSEMPRAFVETAQMEEAKDLQASCRGFVCDRAAGYELAGVFLHWLFNRGRAQPVRHL